MLGFMHSMLSDFIASEYGVDTLVNILEDLNLRSEGHYLHAEKYSDDELVDILNSVCRQKKLPMADIQYRFGQFLYPHLMQTAIGKKTASLDFWQFLMNVPHTTHFKVRQAYPSADPPPFVWREMPGKLVMEYQSPRKLCHLAIGLIEAAAIERGENVRIEQKVCMHNGDDNCIIEVIDNGQSKRHH